LAHKVLIFGASKDCSMEITLDDRLTGSLGGVLGMPASADETSLARTDRSALGSRLLKALTRSAPKALLAPADVYRVIPRRTWIRRKAEGKLTGPEFDGLYRLVRLQTLTELVFEDTDRAHAWLNSPKKRLDGATPMDFAAHLLGYEAVQSWLHEIDQGYLA
jgi:putative toxin-antitoxin system antitoxin component (TIGR02293 family)